MYFVFCVGITLTFWGRAFFRDYMMRSTLNRMAHLHLDCLISQIPMLVLIWFFLLKFVQAMTDIFIALWLLFLWAGSASIGSQRKKLMDWDIIIGLTLLRLTAWRVFVQILSLLGVYLVEAIVLYVLILIFLSDLLLRGRSHMMNVPIELFFIVPNFHLMCCIELDASIDFVYILDMV